MSFYLIGYVTLICQSSALWSSLLLVIFVVLVVSETLRLLNEGGILGILILIVFVGGLLILLVSVCTVSFQDQSFSIRYTVFGIRVFASIVLLNYSFEETIIQLVLIKTLLIGSGALILLLVILLQGFTRLTWVLLNYKNSIRTF